jgi:diguanylate cyclase (GGDEF)-like protein
MNANSRARTLAALAVLLWTAHVATIVGLSSGQLDPGGTLGPVLSDVIQLALGLILTFVNFDASKRSEGLGRSFWRLAALAYGLWCVAQGLSVYGDLTESAAVAWTQNLLFCFWFVPLAMAMFLDPESKGGHLDTVTILDFVQAVLVCLAAYVYFFFLPQAQSTPQLAESVWTPYFVGYGSVAVAFILRALVTASRDARALFGRFGIFLAFSGAVDALYYYGPGRSMITGSWFDLLWSALLVVPIFIATTWKQAEGSELNRDEPRQEKHVYTEIFHLLYPLLVLFMSLRIARERLGLAAVVVLLSFVCSSARLLITQHRLMLAKEALRREAAHDGLTSLWNRKSIIEVLDRELQRAERDHTTLGVIMIDVDHFKAINDSRGHAAGDTVLCIIASGIAAMVRPYDSVGRYGGEEFLIVAPGCGLAETWDLAERVRGHVAGCNIMAGGSSVQVSLSLGIATGQSAADMEKLLHAADSALYQAKNAGRNRVEPRVPAETSRAAYAGQNSAVAPASDFWL